MGKKGGSTSTTQTVKLPKEIEQAARQNLNIANEVAALGATPFNGPSIAGFSPQQMAAMQGTDQAAAAFGMPSAVNWQQSSSGATAAPKGMSSDALYTALTGMPPPNASVQGFSGYNTAPIGQAAFSALPPAQKALIQSFVMNPITGAAPKNASVPSPQTKLQINPNKARTPEERAAIIAQNAKVQQALIDRRNSAVTPVIKKPNAFSFLKELQESRMYGGNR